MIPAPKRAARVVRATLAVLATLLAFTTLAPAARAEEDDRQEAADNNFDSVMLQNAMPAQKVPAADYPAEAASGSPATTAPPRAAPQGIETIGLDLVPGSVDVPLARYEGVRARIAEAREAAARSYATLVVLGASTYSGRAVPGGLELHLQLQATLRGPGFWKAVPLVGEEVAVVRARVGNTPIALTNQNGYQVWVTDQVGEVTLDLDLLVPAKGPRGSLEYDFLVARTPVTRFDCTFPEAGLEPRLRRAVRADVTAVGGGTRLSAWLEPTSRVHLVGFKDLGSEDGRAAKVYVETLSLLSVEETTADLFTVFRYDILQAGTNRFDIFVPPGLTVVSADGAGAFRYTLEPGPSGEGGTLLRGETAFPIRDAYEVSVRLARTLDGGPVEVVPPRAVGVEREHGWLGVEVLGTIQLEEASRVEALAVDVAQLPAELVGNAVSPVLQGWRYHTDGAKVTLNATRLPEKEPAAGSVDEVVAVTRIAPEGRATTELSITLRNRLRHSLRLRLPEGVVVRASAIDGEPIKPSRDAEGAVLLPLKRSAGAERPEPFTLTLSLEGEMGALWLAGLPTLALPAVELPVSTLRWDVHVPAANVYTRLYGDVAPQRDEDTHPTGDRALRYTRYWIGADQPVTVTFGYLRGWLRAPLSLLGAALLAMGAVTSRQRWFGWDAGKRARAGLGLAVGAAALLWFGGVGVTVLAAIGAAIGAGLFGEVRGRLRTVREAFGRPAEGEPTPGSWRATGWFGRFVLLGATAFVALLFFVGGLRLLVVLLNPLG